MLENLALVRFREYRDDKEDSFLPKINDTVSAGIEFPELTHAGKFLGLTGWKCSFSQADQVVNDTNGLLAILLDDAFEVAGRPCGQLNVLRDLSEGFFWQRT